MPPSMNQSQIPLSTCYLLTEEPAMPEQSTNLQVQWTNLLHYASLSAAEMAAEINLDAHVDGCCA